ncbi:hypothetical protein ES708_25051 [subsurface metagenome]
MVDGQKPDNSPRIKIANMEKILPEIKKKLADREKYQAEYDDIKLRVPALKKEFIDAEEKYIKLRDEISQTNKRAVSLYLETEPSPFVRFCKKIQQMWRVSKTLFFIELILVAMLVAITIFYGDTTRQTLSLESGFTLIFIILWVRFPKYRQFISSALLAMLIFIYINFVDDVSLKWTLISAGITIIGVGLALQTFSSAEVVEHKLEKIEVVEKKLDEVLKRLPESPDTGNHQTQSPDTMQKPEEKK